MVGECLSLRECSLSCPYGIVCPLVGHLAMFHAQLICENLAPLYVNSNWEMFFGI